MTQDRSDQAPHEGLSDDELTELALACPPDTPIPDDADPIGIYLNLLPGSLPQWYMPPAATRGV